MKIIEFDCRSGTKLAVENGKFKIFIMDKWQNLNVANMNAAKTAFHRVSDFHYFDEQRRTGNVICG